MKRHPVHSFLFWIVLAVIAWFLYRLLQSVNTAVASGQSLLSSLSGSIGNALAAMQQDAANVTNSIAGVTGTSNTAFSFLGTILSLLARALGDVVTLNFTDLGNIFTATTVAGISGAATNAILTSSPSDYSTLPNPGSVTGTSSGQTAGQATGTSGSGVYDSNLFLTNPENYAGQVTAPIEEIGPTGNSFQATQ